MPVRLRRAFTLVEILIVVVILGVLSAIVVPQFASATDEAGRTATIDQLEKLRRATAVYFLQNDSQLPNVVAGDGTWGEMIDQGYLREKPHNFWVGNAAGDQIILRDTPDETYQTDYGWIFDPDSGDVWAGSYDGNDTPLPRP